MKFSGLTFSKSIMEGRYQIYLMECLSPLDYDDSISYSKYLAQLIKEIQTLLASLNTDLQLKCRILDFLTYLMLLGQEEICDLVEEKILPIVQNVCMLDKHLPLGKRGSVAFKGGNASEENKAIEFYRRCLESIMVWAIWLPQKIGKQNEPSIYLKAQRNLKLGGVTFPAESQLIYFKHQYIESCEAKIRSIEVKIGESNLKSSTPLALSLSSQNANTFWKNQNKHLRQNQKFLLEQIQQLEYQVAKLTKEVANRDRKIVATNLKTPYTDRTNCSDQKSPQQCITPKRPQIDHSLLLESIISFEEAFRKQLSSQQIRFKKSLLRPKYTFSKNEHFQVGCILNQTKFSKYQLLIYFTNNSFEAIQLKRFSFQGSIEIQPVIEHVYPVQILSKKQLKIIAELKCNQPQELIGKVSISFEYSMDGKVYSVKDMFVPISTIRFIKTLLYRKIICNEKLAIIIEQNTKVLNDLSEFNQYFEHGQSSSIQDRLQLTFMIDLCGKLMYLVLYQLSSTHLKLQAIYSRGDHYSALTLLKDFEFALT